jgi:small subunit ribosomal protein S18
MVRTSFKEFEFSEENVLEVNYKDVKVLSKFISEQGKILPRRVTGLDSKQQKRVAKLIKRSRIAALLPFVIGKG